MICGSIPSMVSATSVATKSRTVGDLGRRKLAHCLGVCRTPGYAGRAANVAIRGAKRGLKRLRAAASISASVNLRAINEALLYFMGCGRRPAWNLCVVHRHLPGIGGMKRPVIGQAQVDASGLILSFAWYQPSASRPPSVVSALDQICGNTPDRLNASRSCAGACRFPSSAR